VEVGDRLKAASQELRRFQEEHGAIQISEQTRVTVEAIAALEGERTQLEIQKGVLGSYARGSQPEIQEIQTRIAEIEKRIVHLRGAAALDSTAVKSSEGPASAGGASDVLIPLGEFPGLGLKFAELKREVLAQEKVYEFLMAQFEEARIREARDLETVTVLDPAVPPLRRSRPRRSLIVILTVGLAVVLSAGMAFAAELLGDAVQRRPEWATAGEVKVVLGLLGFLRRWGGPAPP
jgi:capsule polysaccharide export protein KpsE/RkpR